MKIAKFFAAGVMSVALSAGSASAELDSITIGTNPSGSVYFLIASNFARVFQTELGVRSTAQPFTGSSVYLPSINQGEVTIGLSSTVDSGLAYSGEGEFPVELTDLRALGGIWSIPYALIARGDSDIETADDLAGRRFMGDFPASSSLTRVNEAYLRSGGLGPNDLEFMTSGGLMDGLRAVAEGRADVAPAAISMPALIELNATVDSGLKLIPVGSHIDDTYFDDIIAGVSAAVTKPNDQRPFVTEDTDILSFTAMLITGASLSDDDAYLITKTLYDNWAALQEDVGPLRGYPQDQLALEKPTVPYHPGAIRFYEEVGLWTDAHAAAQAEF